MDPNDNFEYEDDCVVVYTDGACPGNGRPNARGGIGVYFGPNHRLNVSKPLVGRATNNIAELEACIRAAKIAEQEGINLLKIKTDSNYVYRSMTEYIKKWIKRNWKLVDKDEDVKNKKYFLKLYRLRSKITIKWEYVRGHSNIQGNIQADSLAVKGAEMYKPNH